MPFGWGKSRRRRQLADLPDDWVGWLEPSVEVEGKLKFSAGLIRLNSHFKGEIYSEGTVVIHDQGEVEGEVRSKLVSITGKLKGSVYASERIEIKENGVVMGDIYTSCLVVDPGGVFAGQCHMPTPEPASLAPADVPGRDREHP
jgi:cytoskeletal protein CcmA (bactofilin family)